MLLHRIKHYEYVLVALSLSLLFFYPIIFSDRTLFFRDIHLWFYPMKAYLAKSLKSGSVPYWSPQTFCGSPFISDLQSGLFYPISLVFILLPFPRSFNLYIIIHLFLGFCFFYQFIRALGLSRESALITSISYSFGGYTIASVNTLNNLSTLIWLPAILWSFGEAIKTGNRSRYFLTVLFLSMAVLGGEPQLFILSVGLLFLYALTTMPRRTAAKHFHIRTSMVIGLLLLSAVLVTMVQIGPTYIDYQHSVRLGGITYEEASRHSLDSGMLKHFIFPLRFQGDFTSGPAALQDFFPGQGEIPWLLTIYPGLMILPMALLGLFLNFHKKFLLWPVTFFIALILALGRNTPAHYFFYKIFPFFRFPDKFMFLASFSLLVMAAFGFDRLISMLKNRVSRPHLLSYSIALLMVFDLYSAHRNINPSWNRTFYQYHHPYLQTVLDDPETFRVHLDPQMITSPSIEPTINNHHIRWQMMLTPNLGMLHNLSHVGGVPALELRYQHLITEILSKPWSQKIHFLRLANVKYIITNRRLESEPGLEGRVERINPLVYRIKGYLPRAWMVGKLQPVGKGSIDEIIDASFDPTYAALGKSEIADKHSNPFFRRVESIRYGKPGKIHIELTAEKPAILVLSESSYPGWRVFVDRKEREVLWLDLLFQGVEIGKGKHRVDFVYRPAHFYAFLLISLSALALFLIVWWHSWVSARKARPSTGQTEY